MPIFADIGVVARSATRPLLRLLSVTTIGIATVFPPRCSRLWVRPPHERPTRGNSLWIGGDIPYIRVAAECACVGM